MIIVKFIGGLGNQMFQIAFARMLSLEFNEDIYFDISSYKNYKIRSFSISYLSIGKEIKNIEESKVTFTKVIFFKLSQKIYHLYQKIVKNRELNRQLYKMLTKFGLYYNFDVFFDESSNNNKPIKCVYGYFQSEKYFTKYRQQISNELRVTEKPTTKEEDLLNEIRNTDSVGVSIRLGDDYVKSSSLNVCKEEFYYRGMDYIYKKNKNVIFYIFSDSIDRAKTKFKFRYPVRYIEGFNDYQSLRLLYTCKHFIISNSSFSWWGAYLSDNVNKMVVVPNRWTNGKNGINRGIYLDDMILLDV